jgi:calicheamicin 3'-O-methyl-rhamnosyltransferase
MLGALAASLPLLFLPQGTDQHSNADRVVAAGAARKLLRNEITAPAVRESVATLIGEPGYRLAAERIAAEIAAMPPPAQALAAITTSLL